MKNSNIKSSLKKRNSGPGITGRGRKDPRGLLWILPSLVGISVFYLLPYLDVFRRSFTGAVEERFTGLDNYRNVLGNTAFLLAVKNTLRFTLVCIPILVLTSLLCAVLLYGSKFGGILKSAFLMPMALPAVSVALLWRLLFHSQGMANQWMVWFGMQGSDWMNTGKAFWILVASYIWKNLGYDIILWMAALSGIPESIYEAARVDGAGEWQCFLKITLPNLRYSLYTIAVLSFLNSFKVFREAYLVAGNYPHESIYMMQHLFNNWFQSFSFDKLSAAAVMEGGVLLLVILFLQKVWRAK